MDGDESSSLAGDPAQIEALIEQARAGCPLALGRLLEACRGYLVAIARQKVSSSLQSKVSPSDLVQETSLDAHRDFAGFRGERLDELLAWLRSILLCNASNASRRYSHTAKRQISREVPMVLFPAQMRDNALSPLSLLATSEERRGVQRALGRLTEDQRRVIVLRSREHYSFVEIGEQMDRSADAVRKLWFRAIERLQQELREPDDQA